MKWCPGCHDERPREAFARDSSRPDGLKSRCKRCDCDRARAYYEANREAVTARVSARAKKKRVSLPPRICRTPGCGGHTLTRRRWYCGPCGLKRSREASHNWRSRSGPQRSAAERGYGPEHQRERERWVPRVERGDVACARCGRLIAPGAPWHLDHTDDRAGYLGPSHDDCNLRAGAVKGNRARNAPPRGTRLAGW